MDVGVFLRWHADEHPSGLTLATIHLDGQLVGHVGGRRQGDGTFLVASLVIVPAARRRGVGRQAVRELIGHLRPRGVVRLRVKVASPASPSAAFWPACGFALTVTSSATDTSTVWQAHCPPGPTWPRCAMATPQLPLSTGGRPSEEPRIRCAIPA